MLVKGWTQANAAIEVGVSSGTASRIVRRLRFPDARPVPLVPRRRGGRGGTVNSQGDFGF